MAPSKYVYYYHYFFDPGTQLPGNEKITLCNTKSTKVKLKCLLFYLLFFLTPVLNSQGIKKIMLCNTKKIQKSSWNEPYSSSFTKQSRSKMALYR